MANYLNPDDWKEIADRHAVNDAGLRDTLVDFTLLEARGDPNDYADELSLLKDVNEVAGKLKNSKALKKNNEVVTYLNRMLKAAAAESKKIQTAKKNFEKESAAKGLKLVDVIFSATDWEGEPMRSFCVFLYFDAPGFKTVSVSKRMNRGKANFDDIQVPPQGTMTVSAVPLSQNGATIEPEGVCKYQVPKKGIMYFEAAQASTEVKKRASSAKEASKRSGAKGTVGIDIKIYSAQGELIKEREDMEAEGEETEWTIKFALRSFTVKQV